MKRQEYHAHPHTHVTELEPEDTDPGDHQVNVLLRQTDGLLNENKRLRVELEMGRDRGIKFLFRMFPVVIIAQNVGIWIAVQNQNFNGVFNIIVSMLYMTGAVTYLYTRRKYERRE